MSVLAFGEIRKNRGIPKKKDRKSAFSFKRQYGFKVYLNK